MTTNDQHNKETSKKKIYIFFYSIQIRALTQNNTHMHKYTAERMTTRTYQCLRLNWILRAEDLVFGGVYRDTANARMYADVDAVPRAPHAYASYVFAPCRAALIGFSLHWRSTLAVNMVASTEHSFAVHDALFAWHFLLLHFFLQYLQAEDEYWMAIDTNNMWLLWYLFLLCRIDSMNAIVLGSILLFVRAYIACEWKMNESSRKPLCYVHILWCP